MALFASIRARAQEHGNLFTGIAIIFVLALIFFVTLGGISQNSRWHIDTVNVSGATIVSADEIKASVQDKLLGNYYFVYARDNSVIFPKSEIERSLLQKFPRLETATVTRIDMHTISVAVTERRPYDLWCGEQFNAETYELTDCWFVDNRGYIFDKAPIFSQGVYLELYGKLDTKSALLPTDNPIGSALPASRFEHEDELATALRSGIGDPLRIVLKPDGESEVTILTSALYPELVGVTLKLKDEVSPVTIVKNLKAAIREEFAATSTQKRKLLYVDMRFGNKIFFGFQN